MAHEKIVWLDFRLKDRLKPLSYYVYSYTLISNDKVEQLFSGLVTVYSMDWDDISARVFLYRSGILL